MKKTETDITTRDNVRLQVRVFQSDQASAAEHAAPALLLAHGWPNSGRVWERLAEDLLRARDFTLVCPDLRGFGDSENASSGYTCETFANDLEDVADALKLTRYLLVGHSMSGKFAQLLASRQPENLAALVLIAPTPLTGGPGDPDKTAMQRSAYGDRDATSAIVLGMAAQPLAQGLPELLIADGLKTSQNAWNGWLQMREEPFPDAAARIGVPTLIVAGEQDPVRSLDQMRETVAEKIKNAQFTPLPRIGHLPHLEDPAALALLIVNFLDRSLPPSAT